MIIRIQHGSTSFTERLVHARRKVATAALVVLAVWIVVHVMVSPNGIVAYQKKRTEYRELQSEIKTLQQKNDEVATKNKALKENDPKAIEREAREQLHYAKPGEVVYVTPEPKRPVDRQIEMESAEKKP